MTSQISSRENPEPVPAATQLLGMAFMSGIDGYLRRRLGDNAVLRITIHRLMTRDGYSYLQQLCAYLSEGQPDLAKVGRLNPVTEGIIGRAYAKKSVVRTRWYEDEAQLNADLVLDMKDTNDNRPAEIVGASYLAIPMLNRSEDVATIFYADAKIFNLFATNEVVETILGMCIGFCRTIDELISHPMSGFRNFPLETGTPVEEPPTVYPRLQEEVSFGDLPKYKKLDSLNFETRL